MRLLLVKHAPPELDFDVPASEWVLSDDGKRRATILAERLAELPVAAIWTSPEPKAAQTAGPISEASGILVRRHDGLIEHRREAGELEPSAFRSTVRAMFRRPDEIFFGLESANEALQRFAQAIREISAGEEDLVVVVTHGTVISLYAEAVGAVSHGSELWDRLTLPAVVALNDGRLHAIERLPTHDFMRDDDIPTEEEIERLRDGRELGRLGDALRARREPGAVSVLEEAIAKSATPAERAVNQLRWAIALQYEHRLIEALDAFDVAAEAIEKHSPAHRHYLAQHHGKCLIEAARHTEGVERLTTAASLREVPELKSQFDSSKRALAAARMRARAYEWQCIRDHYTGLGRHFSDHFRKHGPESASDLPGLLLGAVVPAEMVHAVCKWIAESDEGGTGWNRFSESVDEWLEQIPEILTHRHLAAELEEIRSKDETFRTTIFWWAHMKPLADTLGIQPHGRVRRAADLALVETFPKGRLYRVTGTAWFVDARDAIERVALREVEDRARQSVLDWFGTDEFVEQFWRDEGPRLRAHRLEITVSDDADLLAAVKNLSNLYGGNRSAPWPTEIEIH